MSPCPLFTFSLAMIRCVTFPAFIWHKSKKRNKNKILVNHFCNRKKYTPTFSFLYCFSFKMILYLTEKATNWRKTLTCMKPGTTECTAPCPLPKLQCANTEVLPWNSYKLTKIHFGLVPKPINLIWCKPTTSSTQVLCLQCLWQLNAQSFSGICSCTVTFSSVFRFV